MSCEWLSETVRIPDEAIRQTALNRQAQLTKPPGSLGRLEDIAVHLAAMQQRAQPRIDQVQISVFAADHGIVAEGVAAYPQAVTVEMVKNFSRGGAAISVLARELGATLDVVNVGTQGDPGELPGVFAKRISAGTANFARQPAMTENQLTEALLVGREFVQTYSARGIDLFIGGEMGIGNTSSATALACALLDLPPEDLAGPGTGLNPEGVRHKAEVIQQALQRHAAATLSTMDILRIFGGLEIAALTGAYLRCAQLGIPVLLDGFICGVAALLAQRLQPECNQHFILAHLSAEPGHRILVEALGVSPLLNLDMRLGEASGAAVAVPLLRMACALHNNMATFAEAGVSNKE